jgi:hypothetical protein
MRAGARVAVVVLVGLVLVSSAAGSGARAWSTLDVKSQFRLTWDIGPCPSGTPPTTVCAPFSGKGVVPGLGHVKVRYTIFHDVRDHSCGPFDFSPVVFEVAGKGVITASLSDPAARCWGFPPRVYGPFLAAVSGGSGRYAGASGGGSAELHIYETLNSRRSTDSWVATLTVPGLEFDTTTPVLSGIAPKVVRAPAGTKRVPVRFAVTARHAVDGSVPVSCRPRSGSRFRLGRTSVTCLAEDESGNVANANFRVTVRQR